MWQRYVRKYAQICVLICGGLSDDPNTALPADNPESFDASVAKPGASEDPLAHTKPKKNESGVGGDPPKENVAPAPGPEKWIAKSTTIRLPLAPNSVGEIIEMMNEYADSGEAQWQPPPPGMIENTARAVGTIIVIGAAALAALLFGS